jgi:hypothetical protein
MMIEVQFFRWVCLDGKDYLRWQRVQTEIKPGATHRLYIADSEGRVIDAHPLLELPITKWESLTTIEVKAEWYERNLTIRYFDGHEDVGEIIGNPKYPVFPCSPAVVWVPGPASVCRPGSSDMPGWLQILSEQKRTSLTSSYYYKCWDKTTTNRCVDLSRVESDNPQHLPLYWREDQRLLFHGDEEQRSPKEIFQTGLTAPEPYGSLEMRPGSHVGALESFSYSFHVSAGFDEKTYHEGVPESGLGYVYLIDAPGGLMHSITHKSVARPRACT